LAHTTALIGDLLGHTTVANQLQDFKIERMVPADNYDDACPAYWFGTGPLHPDVEECIRQRVVGDMVFSTPSPAGPPRVDTAKLVKFIKAADEVSNHLFLLLQTTPGQPARLPRLSYLLYKNVHTAQRGVYVRQGRVFVSGHWDKNRTQGQDPPSGIRFPDRTTSALLLLFICFVRPLYDTAVRCYYKAIGEQERPKQDTCMLLQWRGRRVTDSQLGNTFKALFTRYFKTTSIGVAAWRHASKALVRRFLPPHLADIMYPTFAADDEDDSEEDLEATFADMAAHRKKTSKLIYGRLLDTDEVAKHEEASSAYQQVFGLEPTAQPRLSGPSEGIGSVVKTQDVRHAALYVLQSPECQQLLTSALIAANTAVTPQPLTPVQARPSPRPMDAAQAFGPFPLVPSAKETISYSQHLRDELGPQTTFRSANQLMLLHALRTSPEDCLGVVRVGGGKSTLLNVAAKVSNCDLNG
jgi:hypothetical protein